MTKFFTLMLAAAIGCASIGCNKDKDKKEKDGKKAAPAEKDKKKE